MAKKSADQYLAEFLSDPQNAPLALYAGAALDSEGRHDEALAVWTFGDDANPAFAPFAITPRQTPNYDPIQRVLMPRLETTSIAYTKRPSMIMRQHCAMMIWIASGKVCGRIITTVRCNTARRNRHLSFSTFRTCPPHQSYPMKHCLGWISYKRRIRIF